jgi:PadR family transcriptional regulator PadR
MQKGGRRGGWRWRGSSRGAVRFVEPALLLLLHHRPAHGYTLIEQLREFGLSDMDPSAIYRVLREMEEKGWVSSSWQEEEAHGPPRRVYRLSALGDKMLSGWTHDLRETRRMIDHILGSYARHMEEGRGDYH